MYYGTYTCLTKLILVLKSLFLYFESYTCIIEHILVLRILYGAYSCTKVSVDTAQIHYTEVPVGTTGLILILLNLYLFYRYGSTRRHYRDFTCTKVPIGTT